MKNQSIATYLIDNEVETTFGEFFSENEDLSNEQKESVCTLKVGESVFVGICEVKRIA